MQDAAPEVTEVVVEGMTEPPGAALLQIGQRPHGPPGAGGAVGPGGARAGGAGGTGGGPGGPGAPPGRQAPATSAG